MPCLYVTTAFVIEFGENKTSLCVEIAVLTTWFHEFHLGSRHRDADSGSCPVPKRRPPTPLTLPGVAAHPGSTALAVLRCGLPALRPRRHLPGGVMTTDTTCWPGGSCRYPLLPTSTPRFLLRLSRPSTRAQRKLRTTS
ncbi:hypothetical protein MTO96_040756 [Rhipicephalus appendiculatus]